MVLPFLGIYMTNALGFTFKETGTVLACYGVGAAIGSVLGGWLTDKAGHFKTQAMSLFLTVPVFFILPLLKTPALLAGGVFVLSVIADTFRPANSVSVSYYAKPENITKAFSLNRMAINLGFSIGPALGGVLSLISYNWLFYGNAVMACVAGCVFYFYFNGRKGNAKVTVKHNTTPVKPKSPYNDRVFIVFNVLCSLYAICFFQLLSTLPLFYKTEHKLEEEAIGLILGFSGFVVFALEMLMVHIAERKLTPLQVIVLGTVLCGVSFAMLNLTGGLLVLYGAMFVLCLSEILVMPFIATVTIRRSTEANRGAYMGFSSLAYALAHIVSPYIGTRIAGNFGFESLWYSTALATVLIATGFYFVMRKM